MASDKTMEKNYPIRETTFFHSLVGMLDVVTMMMQIRYGRNNYVVLRPFQQL